MDDEISRNTLLRYVADWQYSEAIIGNEAVYDTIEKFYHMVEEMPSVQPKSKREWYMCGYRDAQRWIPVTERLPEDGLYIVTTSKGQVQVHVFSHNGNSEEYWMRCNKAWMPLPEPYKEGQDEDD